MVWLYQIVFQVVWLFINKFLRVMMEKKQWHTEQLWKAHNSREKSSWKKC